MRLLFWLIVMLLATVLALFAASNREAVTLALWPFNVALELPLYLAILCAICVGLVIGAFFAWSAGRHGRREARRRSRRIVILERELAGAHAHTPSAEAPPALVRRG
jgi:lipopolysaccharide assembly protein A